MADFMQTASTESKTNEEKCINILLLASHFDMKTTFINAFANYLRFQNFNDVTTARCLLSVALLNFSVVDAHGKTEMVKLCTNRLKHEFNIPRIFSLLTNDQIKIQLIFIPNGRGEKYIQDITKFLMELNELHAIFVLTTSYDSKLRDFLPPTLQPLLVHLSNQCCDNIMFILPHINDDKFCLLAKKLIMYRQRNLPKRISINYNNIFDLNFESFKYFMAAEKSIEVDKTRKYEMIHSWEMASETCKQIISRIVGDQNNSRLIPFQINKELMNSWTAPRRKEKREMADFMQTASTQSKINEEKCINILLLVSNFDVQTTFINAFANYLRFQNFNDVTTARCLLSVALSNFSVVDDYGKTKMVKLCTNRWKQEFDIPRMFSLLTNDQIKIQLIFIPNGRGGKYIQDITKFLMELNELHAIFVLTTPYDSELSDFLPPTLESLLVHLSNQCCDNIMFILPNINNEKFCLLGKKLIMYRQRIKPKSIPINYNNIFDLNLEPFKYFMAAEKSIEVDKTRKYEMIYSWEMASDTCKQIISRIVGDKSNSRLIPFQINKESMDGWTAPRRNEKSKLDICALAYAYQFHQHNVDEAQKATRPEWPLEKEQSGRFRDVIDWVD